MGTEAILARLQGVRRSGSGWTGRCPAHEDRSPSLSVSEGRDGRVLVHCFTGCSVESVCEALQIRVSDLFTKRGASERKPEPVRRFERQIAGLRRRLTPRDRERAVVVVRANHDSIDLAIARALALAIEGEIVQVALDRSAQ